MEVTIQEHPKNTEQCALLDFDVALATVERALCDAEHEPFFGTSVDIELQVLNQLFADHGSVLHPRILHRQQWRSVIVEAGSRSCVFLNLKSLEMMTEKETLHTSWPSAEAAVDAVVRFLDGKASFAEFADTSPPKTKE